MKKSPTRSHAFLCLLIVCLAFATLPGCGGGGTSGGGGGSQATPTPTSATGFSYGGKLYQNMATKDPLPGATVNLYSNTKAITPVATVVTGLDGAYLFTNLAAGDYIVKFSLTAYITMSFYTTISSNQTGNETPLISPSQWNTLMGDSQHSYYQNYAYVVIQVLDPNHGPIEGVVIPQPAGSVQQIGYFNESDVVNWAASGTFANAGRAFLYKVAPGASYTITATKPGYTFQTLTGVTPVAGEISVYSLWVVSSPTPTPTPTPTQ